MAGADERAYSFDSGLAPIEPTLACRRPRPQHRNGHLRMTNLSRWGIDHEVAVMTLRIVGALLIGGLIGLERSFHGRPAGFRTHSLVCVASALLMLVTVYQNEWMTQVALDAIRTDPTRMAQGIMTGIGFLGAGVIFKEGLTVRGLTTAASIWVTASIGVLVGIGFWFPALLGTAATLTVLSVFRAVENRLPSEFYAHHHLRFKREAVMPEEKLRELIGSHGFTIANLSTRLIGDGKLVEYRMVIRSRERTSAQRLTQHLLGLSEVIEFRISPTGD
jgi:putative Mg2+ transporter-C (MgtC) family protein